MNQRSGAMTRLGDVVDIKSRLSEIDALRRTYRREQIARHGWAEDVTCPTCGDTGRQPDAKSIPCYCRRGQEIEQHLEREAAWEATCPRRFRRFTLESHPNRPAVEQVTDWLASGEPQGRAVVLYGSVGTGKTGLAIAALRELHLAGKRVRYGTVPDLLDGLRPKRDEQKYDEVSMHDLQRIRVLLMDDIGVEKATEWQAETIYKIINGRYERELPTIVTTNVKLPDLRNRIGERAMSRLTDDAVFVHVNGQDLRRMPA